MNFFINQEINIHQLKINGLSNSSVLQVGSAGMIKPISNLYNTGGFTGPAPQIPKPGAHIYVPLPAPS
ncbi:spore germination protein PB [Scopulibacillus darangshiensis]|uniref:Spore germination protein PB n=1 Tax=Scopulibacillus darangshiensis TaxID=442528 RepID=A0A4V2SNK7_9BACL|nr:spore germination protein GerPB [Scopulibacillus darangshiensis]TCP31596.1 spore germination protein PB [Scopulibacillus darangshiensis]